MSCCALAVVGLHMLFSMTVAVEMEARPVL